MKNIMHVLISFLLLGCSPSTLKVSQDTTSDAVVEEKMHGGSPVPESEQWSECGGKIGDHPCNFSFLDQNGDEFNLYQNYGKVILLDFSAMWCGVCNNIAHDAQRFTTEYADKDFMWVTVLVDNDQGQSVTQNEAWMWSEVYGITDSPVLAADRSVIDLTAENGIPVSSWPTILILNRKMIIKEGINGWNEQVVKSWIENEL